MKHLKLDFVSYYVAGHFYVFSPLIKHQVSINMESPLIITIKHHWECESLKTEKRSHWASEVA